MKLYKHALPHFEPSKLTKQNLIYTGWAIKNRTSLMHHHFATESNRVAQFKSCHRTVLVA